MLTRGRLPCITESMWDRLIFADPPPPASFPPDQYRRTLHPNGARSRRHQSGIYRPVLASCLPGQWRRECARTAVRWWHPGSEHAKPGRQPRASTPRHPSAPDTHTRICPSLRRQSVTDYNWIRAIRIHIDHLVILGGLSHGWRPKGESGQSRMARAGTSGWRSPAPTTGGGQAEL